MQARPMLVAMLGVEVLLVLLLGAEPAPATANANDGRVLGALGHGANIGAPLRRCQSVVET